MEEEEEEEGEEEEDGSDKAEQEEIEVKKPKMSFGIGKMSNRFGNKAGTKAINMKLATQVSRKPFFIYYIGYHYNC